MYAMSVSHRLKLVLINEQIRSYVNTVCKLDNEMIKTLPISFVCVCVCVCNIRTWPVCLRGMLMSAWLDR